MFIGRKVEIELVVARTHHVRYLGSDGFDLAHEYIHLFVIGGEYESLVLDCPLFKDYRIELQETEVILDDEDSSVGNLRITKAYTVQKHKNQDMDKIQTVSKSSQRFKSDSEDDEKNLNDGDIYKDSYVQVSCRPDIDKIQTLDADQDEISWQIIRRCFMFLYISFHLIWLVFCLYH